MLDSAIDKRAPTRGCANTHPRAYSFFRFLRLRSEYIISFHQNSMVKFLDDYDTHSFLQSLKNEKTLMIFRGSEWKRFVKCNIENETVIGLEKPLNSGRLKH